MMASGRAMKVLRDIPFSLDAACLMKQLRIDEGSGLCHQFEDILGLAVEHAKPKAMYREVYVARTEEAGPGQGAGGLDRDRIQVGEVTFTSRALKTILGSAGRVFPYVATCGREMDEVFPAKGDVLKGYWWDTIKADLLDAACAYLGDHIRLRFRLEKTSTMSPGSGDVGVWPIEQQHQLFSLLGDVRAEIGVTLTDSFLMIPNKSVSGIVFPTERDFRSCQVCHREDCPSRSAPFDEDLWDSIEPD